eukprot:jgi/Chlat1/247/Chrsp1S03151
MEHGGEDGGRAVALEASLDLLRRSDPGAVPSGEALDALMELVDDPELAEELSSRVDRAGVLVVPEDSGDSSDERRAFLACVYNREGSSHRSPWSGRYYPPLPDPGGHAPSPALRALEIEANYVWDAYRHAYHGGGVSSAYLWDLEEPAETASPEALPASFAACFLIKKEATGQQPSNDAEGVEARPVTLESGSWDAIHVVEVEPASKSQSLYRLTSTVMLSLTTRSQKTGLNSVSGSLTRQAEQVCENREGHLVNIGKLIEEMEAKLRNTMDEVYFGKTREVIGSLRLKSPRVVGGPPMGMLGMMPGGMGGLMGEMMRRRKS